jgi:TRAP-type C4-dicarboxylate transport system substrate-binding protein
VRTATLALLVALALSPSAHGEVKYTLRMATVAPDGTAWAREVKAFSREVAEATHGEVQMKWYFGGIAGDDLQVQERIRKDQLDGVGSGGMLCERVSPSFRGLRVPGLYQSREEVRYVAQQMRPTFEQEFSAGGYAYLGHAVVGPIVIATRHPVRTLAELKRERMWMWDLDEMTNEPLKEMGLSLVGTPIDAAGAAYTDGKVDGFFGIPMAILAFQWSAQARYVSDVHANFLVSCLVTTNRAMDRLPLEHRQAIRSATAKLSTRLEAVEEDLDRKLLGGLFKQQGLLPAPTAEGFGAEFFEAAHDASLRLGAKLIAPALLKRMTELLATYRAAHPKTAKN